MERYGIAEWYGIAFNALSPARIRELAGNKDALCPFKYPTGHCKKAGGVCSLRLYSNADGKVLPSDETIVTMCPNRFMERGRIFSYVAETLIGTSTPFVAKELPFLMAGGEDAGAGMKSVGMIDMILVNQKAEPLNWCAMEMQSVYFSGKSMSKEINAYKHWTEEGIPFPTEIRRPDYRSSGPKRLMPQLQIKVPTISRWGKKTAVVVDRSFWRSLSVMPRVDHVSNCDIAWFIMDYMPAGDGLELFVGETFFTTLQDAVSGLTGGTPTSLERFEENLRKKMNRSGFQVEPGKV